MNQPSDAARPKFAGAHARLAGPPAPVSYVGIMRRLADQDPATLMRAAVALAYTYRAIVVRIVDGDTVRLDVDLGFGVWKVNQAFRLLGCNARELSEPGGKEARDNLAKLMPPGSGVTIRSVKIDKYGDRFDAQIILPDGRELTECLVEGGWVCRWDGAGPRPVPAWPIPEK